MNRSSLPNGLATLKKWKEEKGTLRFDVKFQRKQGMWSQIQKSMLVWSILSDSYIPPLVFNKADEDMVDDKGKSMAVYSVIDGLQRTSSLFSFMNDEYRLHGATPDVDIDGETFELAGYLFSELPQELQNLINAYKFTIQVIANATEEELEQLFININSGKELSVIQKAKPKLGIELCTYFSEILEMPFFSQGVSLTAAQALREEDLALALQSMILLTEDYDDWKSLSVAECFKVAEYLRTNMTERDKKDFQEVVDYMKVFDKKTKYLRKNNVAVILKLAEQMILEGIDAVAFKAFLNEFFTSDNEEYKKYSGAGNVKRNNVEARYRVLMQECYRYFKLDENLELNEAPSSSDELSPAKSENDEADDESASGVTVESADTNGVTEEMDDVEDTSISNAS